MPVESLWRWLRENVTYHHRYVAQHSYAAAEDLIRRRGL
jgi:hypothetical protein